MKILKEKAYVYKIYFPESEGTSPSYSIYTPSGKLFLSGESNASNEVDKYEAIVTIPSTAPSSSLDVQWKIVWTYSTNIKTIHFDVFDETLQEQEVLDKALFQVSIKDREHKLRIVVPLDPINSVTATLYNQTKPTEFTTIERTKHRLGTALSTLVTMKTGSYQILWEVDGLTFYQTLYTIPLNYITIASQIRFLVDRVLKRAHEPQGYLDSDIFAAILGGIDYINGYTPQTEWSVLNFPKIIAQPYLVFAGAWWLLNSQFMLEADLAFSYSGQQVQLDYDRTGPIESELSRLQEYMQEHLPNAKKKALRMPQAFVGLTESGLGPGRLRIRRNVQTVLSY